MKSPILNVALAGLGLLLALVAPAAAGGLFLPGVGPVSSTRAGAAVASTDDAEATAINPAGLASVRGTQLLLSTTFLSRAQTFRRNGAYDAMPGHALPWAGQPYPTITDASRPEVGIGSFQALPLLGVATDLGGRVPGLALGLAVFAPTAYPTRSMEAGYQLDDPQTAPPASRYDVVEQSAVAVMPSLAAAYRARPWLDLGARVTWGVVEIDNRQYVWGIQNYEEWVGHDAEFHIRAKDAFVPGWGVGLRARPSANWELGAQFSSEMMVHAQGDATSLPSKDLNLSGIKIEVGPTDDEFARCSKGGTKAVLKGCVSLAFPMHASFGARYKFGGTLPTLLPTATPRGDVELNVAWEQHSAERSTDYLVVVDGVINNALELKDTLVRHGLRDTWNIRGAGSYAVGVAGYPVVLRGGVGYEMAPAKAGWERVDFDGAGRASGLLGASIWLGRLRVDAGAGWFWQGTREVGGLCNPSLTQVGCRGDNQHAPLASRTGADPVNPVLTPQAQAENPVNHGTYWSRYVLLNLGVAAVF